MTPTLLDGVHDALERVTYPRVSLGIEEGARVGALGALEGALDDAQWHAWYGAYQACLDAYLAKMRA